MSIGSSWKRIVVYAVIIWIVPFGISMAIFGIHESMRPLFESIMAVSVSCMTTVLGVSYFKRREKKHSWNETLVVAFCWLSVSIVFDLFLFMWGPMKRPLLDYVYDIGLTYLMIPIITIGIAKASMRTP